MDRDQSIQVSQLLAATFNAAFLRAPEIRKRWISSSYKVGGNIAVGAIMTVQYIGQLDLVLRAMEDERAEILSSEEDSLDLSLTCQSNLSDSWVGSAYEIFRILNAKYSEDSTISGIHHALRLLRVPLEKYQIAQDRKLTDVLSFEARPSRPDDSVIFYDKEDPKRSHLMPRSISQRGSTMWCAIDVAGLQQRWIERRELSDAILSCCEALSVFD